MGLRAHKERMRGQFENLHNRLIRRFSGKDEACTFQLFNIARVNLVSMSETQSDGLCISEDL